MKQNRSKQLLVAVVSATMAFGTQSGCNNSSRVNVDDLPVGESISIKLASKVFLEMVKLPEGPMFGKFEVTQKQWEALMGANPSHFKGPDNPVESVSWNDCQEFLEKLNAIPDVKQLGLLFRLPSKDERWFACLAGETDPEAWGLLADGTKITKENLGEVAWIKENSDNMSHPVGQKKPNAFGLYDMIGNIQEWCQDINISPYEEQRFRSYGDYDTSVQDYSFLRPSRNGAISPTDRGKHLGFRLCAQTEKMMENLPVGKSIFIKLAPNVSLEMVELPNGPLFGKFEVTQTLWENVMGWNPSHFKGPNNPVECVSWNDCEEFLEKFNAIPDVKRSGLVFRLPTDEEWLVACRAGALHGKCRLADRTIIEEKNIEDVAWIGDNSDNEPHPVGQKKPNAFGLYDMYGNVWEWTQSETAVGENRLIRGYSWNISKEHVPWKEEPVLGIMTLPVPPDESDASLGFRLCATQNDDED